MGKGGNIEMDDLNAWHCRAVEATTTWTPKLTLCLWCRYLAGRLFQVQSNFLNYHSARGFFLLFISLNNQGDSVWKGDELIDFPLHMHVLKGMGPIKLLDNKPWGNRWESQLCPASSSLTPPTPTPSPYHCSPTVVSKSNSWACAKMQPCLIAAFSDCSQG